MKRTIKNTTRVLGVVMALSVMTGCKKSFFDGTPTGQYTVDNYFTTTTEVQAATASLYGAPWYNFNCTYSMSIGDVYAGNSTGDANVPMLQFQNMNVTQSNEYLYKGWASLYSVVGQANAIMNNVTKNASKLDAAADVWCVPVLLAYPIIGPVGQTGEILVNATSEDIVSYTPLGR